MGKIYCVMGKSSSGKDTVYKKLKEQYKEFRLIVPYTTRPIREGEKRRRRILFCGSGTVSCDEGGREGDRVPVL